MNSAVPRTTSSMPSVTRKDGIFSRVTNQPLTRPINAATAIAIANAVSERDEAGVEQRPHQHRRKAEQRSDREIEFAGRHQQRHRQGDEAELDRERQGVGDVLLGEKVVIDRPETTEFEGEQHEGAEFRPCNGPHEEGTIFQLSSRDGG